MISIVIPAYNRADTLFEALQSCFAQAHRPLEIVIGDDSTTAAVGAMVAALHIPAGVTLRYERHARTRGQAGNVNWLFATARGERLLLLHDDDLLLPGGLDRLVATWAAHPAAACVFGKQLVVLESGEVDVAQTVHVNTHYARTGRATGVLRPTVGVGLLQQIPNNCYLLDAALARRIGYRDEDEVGYAPDADFGIRLALTMGACDFVLLDDYVSAYRITQGSMMRTTKRNQDHHLIYRYVEALALPAEAEPARDSFLGRHGASAVLDAANAGDLALARRILASPHYDRSPGTVHAMLARLSIAAPRAGAMLRPYLKAGVQAMRRMAEGSRGRLDDPALARELAAVEALAPATRMLSDARRAAYRAHMREPAAA